MGFLQDFKAFALKGNVIDLAVAVVIGTAFNKIVSSLVDSIFMPLIGLILGGKPDFSSYTVAGVKIGEFIQAIIDFTIVAFALFLFVRFLSRLYKKEEPAPAGPSSTDRLLTEIRDELRKK